MESCPIAHYSNGNAVPGLRRAGVKDKTVIRPSPIVIGDLPWVVKRRIGRLVPNKTQRNRAATASVFSPVNLAAEELVFQVNRQFLGRRI